MTLFGPSVFVLFFGGIIQTYFLCGRLCNLDICGQYVTNMIYMKWIFFGGRLCHANYCSHFFVSNYSTISFLFFFISYLFFIIFCEVKHVRGCTLHVLYVGVSPEANSLCWTYLMCHDFYYWINIWHSLLYL